MAIKEVYTSQEVAQLLSLTRQGVEWKARTHFIINGQFL